MLAKETRAGLVRALLVAAIVIGVGVDAFFAIVNFYPIAPKPSRGHTRYVVMPLDPVQAAWFQKKVLDDFNAQENLDVQLLRVDDDSQLQLAVAQAAKDGKDVVGVTLPATQLAGAIDAHLVRPYTSAFAAERIAEDFKDIAPLLGPGKINGKQAFLPRMTVVDVLAYRVSKVRDAILHWAVLRPQIDSALRAINGRGLPADYDLNLAPDQWDAYDVFVMAYYWSHRKYDGASARPRVAHRSGDANDGQIDVAAGLYAMGVSDATLAKTDSPEAMNYYRWEALYRAENLYPTAMYGPRPYNDDDVVAGLAIGELYLAPIDALDAFTLHGGGHEAARAKVDDPGDLEFTELPNGATLALDDTGHGRPYPSFSFRQDWMWGLPVAARSPEIGYRLVQFLWRKEIHQRECEALGMLPTHPEVFKNRVSLFRLGWMTRVFEAGVEQAEKGRAIPTALVAKGLGSVYAQLWMKIVAGGVSPASEAAIADILRAPPPPKPPAAPPPLAGSNAGAAAGSAADDSDVQQAIDRPIPESDDWETVAVFDIATGSATGSAAGSAAKGARP